MSRWSSRMRMGLPLRRNPDVACGASAPHWIASSPGLSSGGHFGPDAFAPGSDARAEDFRSRNVQARTAETSVRRPIR